MIPQSTRPLAARLLLSAHGRCLVELFVYLRVGGSHERIIVQHLSDSQSLRERIRHLDITKAQCEETAAREMLFAVIETGMHRQRSNPQLAASLTANRAFELRGG